MKIRRTLAIAATTMALTAGLLSPAASAQDLGAINHTIDTFNCDVLREGLYRTGLATPETTRSELAATLKKSSNLGEVDLTLGIFGNVYSERIANRALTCGVVKVDPPQDILTQLQNFSSNLSSGSIVEQFLAGQK